MFYKVRTTQNDNPLTNIAAAYSRDILVAFRKSHIKFTGEDRATLYIGVSMSLPSLSIFISEHTHDVLDQHLRSRDIVEQRKIAKSKFCILSKIERW